MTVSVYVSGIAKVGGNFKNIILSDNSFKQKDVKEIMYATEFEDVESYFGFADLDIIEVNDASPEAHMGRVFLSNDEQAQAIVFLRNGFLIITDLDFFTAYTRIGDKEAPYSTVVESNTYEEDEALELISEDGRLA